MKKNQLGLSKDSNYVGRLNVIVLNKDVEKWFERWKVEVRVGRT